jgi:inosine/xanthosine triphosphate pyrophosphatase family protein
MSRRLEAGMRLVVATHNKGKLAEFRDLLGPHGIDLVSAGELGLPEPAETGTLYAENAAIKARRPAHRWQGRNRPKWPAGRLPPWQRAP